MTDLFSLDDDQLVERLRAAARVHDPVPADLLTRSKLAFQLRALDDELADLLFDSLLDDELVGVRGGEGRQLTFGVADVTIDLDLDEHGLLGQVSPAVAAQIDIETPTSTATATVDELGRFFGDRPADGPVRIRVHLDERRVTTEWVTL